jgi:hypothetical protein
MRRFAVAIAASLLIIGCGGSSDAGGGSSSFCGDAALAGGELCDGANLAGESCASRGFTGGTLACAANCLTFDTSACTSAPVCEDGVITGSEVCDGPNLDGESCVTQGFTGGTLACAANCLAFDTSACTSLCGNGTVAGPEVCDGPDLGGWSCASLGFTGGTLSCADDCLSVDTSACTGSTCGNGRLDGGNERCDGSMLAGVTCLSDGHTGGFLSCTQGCLIDPSGCTGGIPGWTCPPGLFGDGYGCDCGCGIRDPDCADATAASCDSCDMWGACGASTCPGKINPTNNAVCVDQACGDGKLTDNEVCDGSNLAGKTCLSLGYTGGTLSCAAGCSSFNTAACTGTRSYSCNEPSAYVCFSSIGTITPAAVTSFQDFCGWDRDFAPGPCASVNRVPGYCSRGGLRYYFYAPAFAPANVATACASIGGTWVP